MTLTLEDFTKDFTPKERAWVATRTAELVEDVLESCRMPVQVSALKSMIASELQRIVDPRVVSHIEKLQVEPRVVLRDWDYGEPGEQYPCWTVLTDTNGSAVIAYCEFGFGPRCPWGLVHDGNCSIGSIGMDFRWYPTFLEAFFESSSATDLPIWRVFKEHPDRTMTPVTDEGEWEATWQRLDELRAVDPTSRYHCRHSIAFKP